METTRKPHEQETHEDNNTGTVGRVTEQEHTRVVLSEHHTPNEHGFAENDEDHRTRFFADPIDDEPRDSINDRNRK